VARQTFKELTPIQQQEFLGGDVFIGNPYLEMSALENFDLRFDYTPKEGSFFSLSYFYKDIENPIEYVQQIADFAYTTPINYPKGVISGWEMEARQDIGKLAPRFAGLSLGANATFLQSEVTLPDSESDAFEQPNIQAPTETRDMTGAPEHLYNLFLTFNLDNLGWKDADLALFYTVTGDTLIAGAGQSKGFYVPDVYAKEYGTLNLSLTKKINEKWSWKFQAKNLTDPKIETIYRSDYINGDVTKTSYQRGMEFNFGLTGVF
jgi:outer membrane receptor protein involved in Fe transport